MAEVIKLSAFGMIGVLLALQFKGIKPEYAVYIGLAVSVLIFYFCVNRLQILSGTFELMKQYVNGSENYLSVLLKVLGITYICEFGAGICKDAGFASIAEQIEVMGKLSVMFAGLPILLAVMEELQNFAR